MVRNRVSSIERAVQSVQSQDHPDIQYIIVDGGSTDGTLELLEHCLHEDAVLLSEPDNGMYDAINKGLRLASGDVVDFTLGRLFF